MFLSLNLVILSIFCWYIRLPVSRLPGSGISNEEPLFKRQSLINDVEPKVGEVMVRLTLFLGIVAFLADHKRVPSAREAEAKHLGDPACGV